MNKVIYYDKLFTCTRCGQDKVLKRLNSTTVPKYCHDCLKIVRAETLKKNCPEQTGKIDVIAENVIKSNATIEYIAPDGFVIKMTQSEIDFYESRLKQYNNDFVFISSSDLGLLSRILQLELEVNRVSSALSKSKSSGDDVKLLTQLTEEYRKCQQDLGVSRSKRMSDKSGDDMANTITELILKFKKYKEENPEKFRFRCAHCHEYNTLNYTNTNKEVVGLKNEPTMSPNITENSDIKDVTETVATENINKEVEIENKD